MASQTLELRNLIETAIEQEKAYVKIESGTTTETQTLTDEIKAMGFKAYIIQKLKLDQYAIIIDL